jgi:hypothetical protein
MNQVLEKLVQGALNGLEYILLKFYAQVNYANFYRTKEPSKIWEDDLLSDSIIKASNFEERCPNDSTKMIP